jgi:hypothetical protein
VKGLLTAILYVSPVVSLLFIMLILFENSFEIFLPFSATGQSTLPPILTRPLTFEPQLVSQSNSINSTQTDNNATNANNTSENNTVTMEEPNDIFGITKIYPTNGAREWFLNMSNPKNSSNFSITDNLNLSKLSDGSWRINASHVRMVVNTSGGQENWKNVEITGYVRLSQLNIPQTDFFGNVTDSGIANGLSAPEDDEIDDLVFISRSGRHSSEVPCEGTAYNAGLHTDGSIGWKKEIWHTGGYTEERARQKLAESYLNKWIGLKVVVYNIMTDNGTSAVKLETYIDNSNSNNWTKVSEIMDSGGWYSKSDDTEFFSAGCGRARDYVIADGGPNVIFRTDNILLDFKDLSIREIQPPTQLAVNANLTSVLKLE